MRERGGGGEGRGGEGGNRIVVLQEGGVIGDFLEFGDERKTEAGRAAIAGDAFRVVLPPEEGSGVYSLTRTQKFSTWSSRDEGGGGRGLRVDRHKGHAIAAFPFLFRVATAAIAELLPVQ